MAEGDCYQCPANSEPDVWREVCITLWSGSVCSRPWMERCLTFCEPTSDSDRSIHRAMSPCDKMKCARLYSKECAISYGQRCDYLNRPSPELTQADIDLGVVQEEWLGDGDCDVDCSEAFRPQRQDVAMTASAASLFVLW